MFEQMGDERGRICGTSEVDYRLLATNPAYAANRSASENRARLYASGRLSARTGITTIPIVVHVVHNEANPEQNISDAQIRSQIDVLNRDYRSQNPDAALTPGVFKPLIADAQIEFRLADKDPLGNPTAGITNKPTTVEGFTTDDSVKSTATGGDDPWPADRYLNIWVAALTGGLLGYAQFPGGPGATDGVVITHTAFGTLGSARPPFNLGRTATHEIGHWLNLRHIWGDDGTGCNGSDFVDDTPNQGGPNRGKPTFPHLSCGNGPNGDLFCDFMDYVDDAAMVMFTAGQALRMQACLSGDRPGIGVTPIEWRATDLTTLLGTSGATGAAAASIFDAQGTQHVVYRDTQDHVVELWWDGTTGWHASDLTIASGAPVAAGDPMAYVFDAEGTQHVVFRSADGHIRELWWGQATGWQSTDLTSRSEAPVASGDPHGYVLDSEGTQHVVYRAADNHVYELWWDSAGGWHAHDLTAASGATLADGDPVGYVFKAEATQHVVYRAENGHIQELWWSRASGWQSVDLTAQTAAPPAIGNPRGYVFESQRTQHITYRAADDHVCELWWDRATNWHACDLTHATGGPASAGDPMGYVFETQATQHIVYRDANSHIQELWWRESDGWQVVDHSVESAAPDATGDPCGYVFPADGTQHVMYPAVEGHIEELLWA
jgi:hypothetical protein